MRPGGAGRLWGWGVGGGGGELVSGSCDTLINVPIYRHLPDLYFS